MAGAGPRRNVFDRLRPLRRLAGPIEAAEVRRFGRSVLSSLFGTRVLVLHTTGRRSGLERSTTLAVHEQADGLLLIVGGAGGQTALPDWVANLRAEARCAVTLDRVRHDVHAGELSGPERSAAWAELAQVWPQIEKYEQRAGRAVPVFRLTPV